MARKIDAEDVREWFYNAFIIVVIIAMFVIACYVMVNMVLAAIASPGVTLMCLAGFALLVLVATGDEIIAWFWNKFIADKE